MILTKNIVLIALYMKLLLIRNEKQSGFMMCSNNDYKLKMWQHFGNRKSANQNN